ncbi:uncharacterized protein LOC133126905 isoform X3 [Conger conger]|nr:uncharacterized protein LOC133126905 isoform X3 [Conger conger]
MSIQALRTVVQEASSEAVPLSITDELEKTNAKILTPRSHSAYLSLPIVSETYPVVLNAGRQHKPFSSPGFHSVGPGQAVYQTPGQRGGRNNNFHSAIVRITQSLKDQRLGRGMKERLLMERCCYSQIFPETAPNMRRMGAHKVKPLQLSDYGDVVKSANMEKFPKLITQCHNSSPLAARTAPAYKRPLVPVITPRQKSAITADVGCVLNGMNPKHCPDISTCSPDYFRGLLGTARMKTNSYQTPPLSQKSPNTNPEDKMGFLIISKPINCNNTNPFVCKEFVCTKEENHTGQTELPVRQVVGIEGVGVYGVSFHLSKANGSAEYEHLTETPAMGGTPSHAPPASPAHPYDLEIHSGASDTSASATESKYASEAEGEGSDSDGVLKTGVPFDRQQAISIPTAKNM